MLHPVYNSHGFVLKRRMDTQLDRINRYGEPAVNRGPARVGGLVAGATTNERTVQQLAGHRQPIAFVFTQRQNAIAVQFGTSDTQLHGLLAHDLTIAALAISVSMEPLSKVVCP
jgi:hypothetical protein